MHTEINKRKSNPKRGGFRMGAGRKPAGDKKKERVTLTLTAGVVESARKLTDNLSGTVDGLLAAWTRENSLENKPSAK